MRRNPFSRRKSRSTCLRFLYISRSYSHGSSRFHLGGTTGIMPRSSTSCLVHKLPGFIALVGAIHRQGKPFRHRTQWFEQRTALRRVVCVARRKRKGYGRPSIRGNQMNFRVPSAARLSNGLWPVFFIAPAPSGCTLTEVESGEKASILIRTIRSDQSLEDPVRNSTLRPAIHAGENAVPLSKSRRKTAPFAALLGNKQDRIEHLQILQPHIPTPHWQAILDLFILLNREFHSLPL